MYEFCPNNNNYTEYIYQPIHSKTCDIELSKICPVKCKLLPGDIINIKGEIMESPYRSETSIPGILVINGNTYGREKMEKRSKHDKSYYKCIPADKVLPSVLISYNPNQRNKKTNKQYSEKNTFSKHKENLYVLFKIDDWKNKHPECTLTNIIGTVNTPHNYYEYLLHVNKLLSSSITNFTKITQKVLREKVDTAIYNKSNTQQQIICEYCHIHKNSLLEDRTKYHIFTIDPRGTNDIDDAIGIRNITDNTYVTENNHKQKGLSVIISIYIANVTWWIDYLNLWEFLSDRMATVYLPHKNVPMLPKILSENMISLFEKKIRPTFCVDILVSDNIVQSVSFHNALICVDKNYVYEEDLLVKNDSYKKMFQYASVLNDRHYKYLETIQDSHDVVAYFMLLMNHEAAKALSLEKKGIYRSVSTKYHTTGAYNEIPIDLKKFIQMWKYTNAEYTTYKKQCGHVYIGSNGGVKEYLQITSPIRRKVDIINMSLLMIYKKLIKSTACEELIKKAMTNIDKMNNTMKSIKKVQNTAKIYDLCISNHQKTTNKIIEGIVINTNQYRKDMLNADDKIQNTEHTIYVPSLQLVTSIKMNNDDKTTLKLYEKYKFSIHIFVDEDNLHRRIRLQPCNILSILEQYTN